MIKMINLGKILMKRFIPFTILTLSSLLLLCCNRFTEIELIVVSKTPRGAYVGEKVPPGHDLAWYEIGLSRNGKEPVIGVLGEERRLFWKKGLRQGLKYHTNSLIFSI